MFDRKIEALAQRIREVASTGKPPVNLDAIAEYDGILLVPVTNHQNFNGKLEFLPEENTFIIFHPDPATYPYPNRLRFSIAHELGHYHIDEHRKALVRGETHSSEPGFRSKNAKEMQADEFAAALLIPADTIEPIIGKRGFMTLEEILTLGETCKTSPYATTIRYVRMASEPCFVTLARRGEIRSSFSSDEARIRRFGKISIKTLPTTSPGHALAQDSGSGEVTDRKHNASPWFGREDDTTLWESCVHIGEGYTLSLVSIELDEDDED